MQVLKPPKLQKGDTIGIIAPQKLVLDILKEYNFPILTNMDFGHYTVNTPMPVGIKAHLIATNKTFEVTESALL